MPPFTLDVLKQLIEQRFRSLEALIFTGDLSLQERNLVVTRFQTEPKCQVLLITLQRPATELDTAH